jgi:hypothetical protein
MKLRHTEDKQLQGIALESVLEKRRLGQAMNVKEFAICVGVSYSTARAWIHISGFPVFHGVIFWQDFVEWRTGQNGLKIATPKQRDKETTIAASKLPARAAQILLDA